MKDNIFKRAMERMGNHSYKGGIQLPESVDTDSIYVKEVESEYPKINLEEIKHITHINLMKEELLTVYRNLWHTKNRLINNMKTDEPDYCLLHIELNDIDKRINELNKDVPLNINEMFPSQWNDEEEIV